MSKTSAYDSLNSYSGRYCPLCGEWIPGGTGVHYCHKSESAGCAEDNNEPGYGWTYGLLWEDSTMKRVANALERIADALEEMNASTDSREKWPDDECLRTVLEKIRNEPYRPLCSECVTSKMGHVSQLEYAAVCLCQEHHDAALEQARAEGAAEERERCINIISEWEQFAIDSMRYCEGDDDRVARYRAGRDALKAVMEQARGRATVDGTGGREGAMNEELLFEKMDRIAELEDELAECRENLDKWREAAREYNGPELAMEVAMLERQLDNCRSWDDPMACGHPMWALEYDNDGNGYCAWCKSLERAQRYFVRALGGLCQAQGFAKISIHWDGTGGYGPFYEVWASRERDGLVLEKKRLSEDQLFALLEGFVDKAGEVPTKPAYGDEYTADDGGCFDVKAAPAQARAGARDHHDLREVLAELEHDQWMHWAKAVMPEVSPERRERWQAYMVPYSELAEDIKDHDRKWADKVLAALAAALEQARAEGITEERERCARKAMATFNPKQPEDADYDWGYNDAKRDIAHAIRQRELMPREEDGQR